MLHRGICQHWNPERERQLYRAHSLWQTPVAARSEPQSEFSQRDKVQLTPLSPGEVTFSTLSHRAAQRGMLGELCRKRHLTLTFSLGHKARVTSRDIGS